MKKILLAYDGGEPAKRALATAIELTKALGASLSVVSVVPTRPGRAPMDPWDDPDTHAKELLEARDTLTASGIEATLLEPAGDPAKTIEETVVRGGFDMVVVGSRHLNVLERALQGSVSEHVATHADATVVIAR